MIEAVVPRRVRAEDGVAVATEDRRSLSAASTTSSYDAASVHTGQSVPNSIRPGRSREHVVGVRPEVVDRPVAQSASVTRPESLHLTFADGPARRGCGPRLALPDDDGRLGDVVDHEATVRHLRHDPSPRRGGAADQQVVDEAASGDRAAGRRARRAQQPSGSGSSWTRLRMPTSHCRPPARRAAGRAARRRRARSRST